MQQAAGAGSSQEEGEDDSCPICMTGYRSLAKRGVKKMKARRCGHVCCSSCWKGWIRLKIECPLCKQIVRP